MHELYELLIVYLCTLIGGHCLLDGSVLNELIAGKGASV